MHTHRHRHTDLHLQHASKLTHTYTIHISHSVIDLGCAPGGWSEVAAQLVLPLPAAAAASSPPSTQTAPPRETVKTGRLIGIDRLPMLPIQGVSFLQGDFTEATTKEALLQALFPSPSAAIEEERKERIRVDVILSDMSPDFMGDSFTDHRRCLDLCYEVRPGGE